MLSINRILKRVPALSNNTSTHNITNKSCMCGDSILNVEPRLNLYHKTSDPISLMRPSKNKKLDWTQVRKPSGLILLLNQTYNKNNYAQVTQTKEMNSVNNKMVEDIINIIMKTGVSLKKEITYSV